MMNENTKALIMMMRNPLLWSCSL